MKKKYIFIISLIIFASIIFAIIDRRESSYRKTKVAAKIKANQLIKKRVDQTKSDGKYLVGKDINEGEYVLVALNTKKRADTSGYYAVYQDTSKTNLIDFSKINAYEKALLKNESLSKLHMTSKDLNEYASDLVVLKDKQLIELKNIKMYPASVRQKFDPSKIIDGTYKVGRDIPEGTYTVSPYDTSRDNFYKICIKSSVYPKNRENESLIASYQDYTNKSYPKEIVVKKGQYLSFDELIFRKKE